MARGCRAVASLLRQRAMGIRRARPDAPPRSQHQRCRDRQKRPPLSLGRTWSKAGRCSGTGRECVLSSELAWLCARVLLLSPCGRGRIASTDAIRVRGYGLTIGRAPDPLPQGERERISVAAEFQERGGSITLPPFALRGRPWTA